MHVSATDEVSELFDGLYEVLKSDTVHNLQRISRSTVILLRQLFGQAEDAEFVLEVDTSALEDDMLLKVAEKMEDDCSNTKEKSVLPEKKAPEQKLVSLDSRKEADALKIETGILKQTIAEKEQALAETAKEKAMLQAQLEEALAQVTSAENPSVAAKKAPGGLRARPLAKRGEVGRTGGVGESAVDGPTSVEGADGGNGGGAEPEEFEDEDLGTVVDIDSSDTAALAARVEELEAQMQERLNNAPQFVALKDMLTKKNAKMKAMREALIGSPATLPRPSLRCRTRKTIRV